MLLEDLEEQVSDAILEGETKDPILKILIDLAATSILEKRQLFENPLHEPVFYRRYFLRWVKDSLDDMATIKKETDTAKSSV